MKRILAAFLVLSGSAASAAEPFVGKWANKASDCGTQFAYQVTAKDLAADEFTCSFSKVSKEGATFVLTGKCDNGDGDSPETVAATVSGGKLSLNFRQGGGKFPGLVRCKAR